jgi:hypothetical protein
MLLSVSLEGPDGFDKSLFIQAKYDRNVNRDELVSACQRMEKYVGREGAYVWIYEPDGVKVYSAQQVRRMRGNTLEGLQRRSVAGLTGRILDCYAGSQAWGIPIVPDRREIVRQRLRQVRIDDGLDVTLKPVGYRSR